MITIVVDSFILFSLAEPRWFYVCDCITYIQRISKNFNVYVKFVKLGSLSLDPHRKAHKTQENAANRFKPCFFGKEEVTGSILVEGSTSRFKFPIR